MKWAESVHGESHNDVKEAIIVRNEANKVLKVQSGYVCFAQSCVLYPVHLVSFEMSGCTCTSKGVQCSCIGGEHCSVDPSVD